MSEIEKAVWDTAYINDLPDSAFAYIEPGGTKDSEGKTVPRSKRHLPYKDKGGKVDPAHVRNALARLPQTNISEGAKNSARRKLVAAARTVGVNVSGENKKMLDVDFEGQLDITKKYVDNEKWYIEGYAGSTELDLVGDIITEEAFKNSEGDLLNNSTVLYNHDPEQSIGKVEEAKATKEGLWIKVLISQTVPDIWQKIKEGVINKFSIRGKVEDAVKRFMKDLKKVVNVINELYLLEASLVALPANPEAKALRWYISKSLQDFETKGGEIPKENDETVVSKGQNMPTISELLKQVTDRLVADEDKALVETLKSEIEKACKEPLKKKSGEEWTQEAVDALEKSIADLQISLDIEKKKQVGKSMDEMNDEEMKAAIALADAIRKKFADKHPYPDEISKANALKKSTGELYTQEEIDSLVKALDDSKAKVIALEKELKDHKDGQEVEKRWDNVKNEYDEKDAPAIKEILKKSISGIALSADETESLVTKKLQLSQLKIGGGEITKEMSEERKQTLIKQGGIRTRIKNS